MKLALAASLLASAAAFAPASQGKASTALKGYENAPGAIAPVGFFGTCLAPACATGDALLVLLTHCILFSFLLDPFGLTSGIDDATFEQYRIGEIKNGRAAMLAVIGYIVPEVFRFPGEISPGVKFADLPNGIAAIDKVPHLMWMSIFFLIGSIDFTGFLGSATPTGSKYFDSGFLSFSAGSLDLDPETLKTRTENEVSNGRLAMLAFWELVRHDYQNLYNPGSEPSEHLIVRSLALASYRVYSRHRRQTRGLTLSLLRSSSKASRSSTESKEAKDRRQCRAGRRLSGSMGESLYREFEAD
jgi:Chlorophyll A-B binding protein